MDRFLNFIFCWEFVVGWFAGAAFAWIVPRFVG